MRDVEGHGTKLSYYHFGATTIFASRTDQRFSYCLYVPRSYREDDTRRYPLAVLVHSTDRDAQYVRDEFIDFAERTDCILLAPLFPAGIDEPGELDNYKFLEFRGIRFDELLLAMIGELGELYRLDAERFLLTGFSGGGHFTHRFLFAHPERVLGASIAAPGVVTLLDEQRAWPAGVGGMRDALGRELDLDAIRRVPVHLVAGDDDTATWEIAIPRQAPYWIDGVNDENSDRKTRIRALAESLARHGVDTRIEFVPGVAHEGRPLADPTKRFFEGILSAR